MSVSCPVHGDDSRYPQESLPGVFAVAEVIDIQLVSYVYEDTDCLYLLKLSHKLIMSFDNYFL